MDKKGIKIIQKGILGRLGRVFFTYAHGKNNMVIDMDSTTMQLSGFVEPVRSVRTSESTEICKDLKTPVRSVRTSQRPRWQKTDGRCYACGGTEAWTSIYNVEICGRCHPPAHEGLVAQSGNA